MHKKFEQCRHKPDARTVLDAVDWPAFWESELPEMPEPNESGWTCGGSNPLRADDRPGSFRVNLDTGAWIDFATDERGDGPDWLMRRYGLDFPGALEVLEGFAI